MPVHSIFSENIKVEVTPHGAELTGLFLNGMDHNWIWSAKDPWKRRAPVLFPIVGKLKNNSYVHEGHRFELQQHGFSRDLEFCTKLATENRVCYQLKSNEKTLAKYPFEFALIVDYVVEGSTLSVGYKVRNLGVQEMYFNLGWHPGFVLPHIKNSELIVSSPKGFNKKDLLENGLLGAKANLDLNGIKDIEITNESFSEDAWIFLDSHLQEIKLTNCLSEQIVVKSSAPHWGIWSNDPLKFICLEPWWGFADFADGCDILAQKKGIQVLNPSAEWECVIEVELRSNAENSIIE